MIARTKIVQRLTKFSAAVVLATFGLAPVVLNQPAMAAQVQMSPRSIQVSDSGSAATGVTYNLTFTPQQTNTSSISGFVIDFCAESPIIGDACTRPNLMDASTVGTVSGSWVVDGGSSNHTLILTRASPTTFTTGTPVTITVPTLTNPTISSGNNMTYYARLFSYTAAATAQAYTSTVPGAYLDYGGIALSVVNRITITAKVQEQLSFCVYTGANCAAGGTALTLGNAGVLDSSTTYTANAKFDLSTNANGGAIVNMKGDTLKTAGGVNSIASEGTTCAATDTPGTAQFGARVTTSGGTLAPVSPYNCTATHHVLDTANTTTTYGQTVANTGGTPTATGTGTVEYAANVSNVTPAGVYTTTMIFIATGTF